MYNLVTDIEDRSTPFGQFVSDFDYHLMETHWKKFIGLYSRGWTIQEIRSQLRVLSVSQLIKMATAFEKLGNSKVEYHAPSVKWDDVHDLLPVELTPKEGPFGVAQVKCEACQRYYTLKIDYVDHKNYLCIKCTEEWNSALLTGSVQG